MPSVRVFMPCTAQVERRPCLRIWARPRRGVYDHRAILRYVRSQDRSTVPKPSLESAGDPDTLEGVACRCVAHDRHDAQFRGI